MLRILLFFYLFFFNHFYYLNAADNIIATVDNYAITHSDLVRRAKMVFIVNNVPYSMQDTYPPQIVDMLINEKLYDKAAKKLKVEVDEKELADYITMIETQNNIPQGQFANYLRHIGVDKDESILQMRSQLLWQKMLHYKFSNYANISQQDQDFYKLTNPEFQKMDQKDLIEGITIYRTNKIAINYLAKLKRESTIVKYPLN